MKRFSSLVRMFQDVLADRTRQRISEQELSVYCNTLARIVEQNYEPDLIVAIDTGGSIPGELIAQAMHIPIAHIVVRRNINIARRYSLDPIPLRWIMSMYHHYLFQTVKPVLSVNIKIDISGRKVLVVDDSLHTGATIDVTVDYLRQANVSEIRIATLTYVSKRKPDFAVLPPGNYSFPWSKDYIKSEF